MKSETKLESPGINTVQSHDHPESSRKRYSYRGLNPCKNFTDFRAVF